MGKARQLLRLTVHVFFLWRKRSDSSDTGVRGVTMSDGPALVEDAEGGGEDPVMDAWNIHVPAQPEKLINIRTNELSNASKRNYRASVNSA